MDSNFKMQLLAEIERKSPVFRKVNNIQYRIRCPLCGDSQSNPLDAHCYIKADYNNPSEPLLYNCFKCNSSGIINEKFLKALGISSKFTKSINNIKYNKIKSIKYNSVNIITGDPIMDSIQVKYLSDRLHCEFTYEQLKALKICWNINNLKQYITNKITLNTLPSNLDSISFLSDDKSVLLTRFFDDNICRWKKMQLFNSENKAFYTISTSVDLFTEDEINVYIAEGIMDVISAYKNFTSNNGVYIAVLGSDYISGIDYVIAKGIVGSNINVNIYIDNDIDIIPLYSSLKLYKWIFKSITVYQNTKSKDIGVPLDMIKLNSHKI